MSSEPSAKGLASEEAARWFAALNTSAISNAKLCEFHLWRRRPENDDAYRQLELLWDQSRLLDSNPSILAALADAKSRASSTRSGRTLEVGFGTAGVVVALGISALALFVGQSGFGQHYRTAVGEQRTVVLSDGTTVRLDTDSQIAVSYSDRVRMVSLGRGQAFFTVAHLTGRPFEVKIGDTVVRDFGTQFDVRREGGQVQVTLVEGLVQVASATTATLRLSPGQQITTGRSGAIPKLVNASAATSWTHGRLVFENLPLGEAVQEVNRYTTKKVVLFATPVNAVRVSGSFDTGDTEGFVSAVTKLYGLGAHRRADGTIVLRASNVPEPE